MSFSIAVQTRDFDVGAEYTKLIAGDTAAGAVVFFVGRVRDTNQRLDIKSMSLEHYPGMTENILQKILDEAKGRWEISAARIIHRVGELQVGDQIVYVGVTSGHREQAFQAAEFLMDFLKNQAPFWKKEIGVDGAGRWVEDKVSDRQRMARWE
ncbi:MAG: molybdenum cofactor biosynthesis protein MoaE [Cellvibrio sp.]|jgi:molybdopterin synthase catalytic subunit|nr:molybdenum cofactor biosynthesis protein MoaE [Cellvibrio sp.]